MTTTEALAVDIQAGDLILADATNGILYTFLVMHVDNYSSETHIFLDVAESVNGSTVSPVWDCRLAFLPVDMVTKLEGVAA